MSEYPPIEADNLLCRFLTKVGDQGSSIIIGYLQCMLVQDQVTCGHKD